jgi:phosphoribosyl 1,2-cyclic phosphodiesterase
MISSCALASGSSGNCFYIEVGDNSYLIDAGLSAKYICQRLNSIGKNILSIKGIFITHEHTDHICGLKTLLKRFNIPIYLTKGTYDSCFNMNIDKKFVNIIKPNKEFFLDDSIIFPFLKSHDAKEPVGYSFIYNNEKISFITDLGYATDIVKEQISSSSILFLESNYDNHMLINGRYPYYLKERIKGKKGHLSNYDASVAVIENATSKLKYVVLSHISLNNNTCDLAYNTFFSMISERVDLENIPISLSFQSKCTNIISLNNKN